MTASTIEVRLTEDDVRIARLAAAAVALSVAEAAFPSPLPGVKPGLANIVVLLVLYRHGLGAAAWVSVLRILATSLLLGSLFSPGFFLAATGAAASLGVLALAQRSPAAWFGPVSLSVLAAFAHIAGQLLLARLVLIPHSGLLYLVPVFAAAALTTGLVNGLIVARIMRGQTT